MIKNRHTRYINIIGLLLCVGSALLFTREILLAGEVVLVYLIGILFIAGLLIWNMIKIRRNERIFFSKALLIAGLVWMKMPYFQWLLFIFVLLAVLEYQAKLPLEIGFSKSRVIFNSLIKRKLNWQELSNVILRDGLLTIDFRSNKLFQKEIDEGESEATEKEFNDWCQEQLIKKNEDISLS